MGVLDQITSGVDQLIGNPSKGAETSTTKTAVMSILLGMVEDGKIGITSLINHFHNNGMSNQVNSWIGTGANEKVSATEIEQALGRDKVEHIAREAGLPPNEAASELATVVPTMIDKFSPNGEVPEPGIVQQAASLLRTKLCA